MLPINKTKDKYCLIEGYYLKLHQLCVWPKSSEGKHEFILTKVVASSASRRASPKSQLNRQTNIVSINWLTEAFCSFGYNTFFIKVLS